jgi:hypothetical protein
MNPETNDCIDLIDLGVASVETQGGKGEFLDIVARQPIEGLTDD